MTFAIPAPMPFAILRCTSKRCRKAVRGDVSSAVNDLGRKVIFVGSIKVEPWNGTLQAPCECGGTLIGKRVKGAVSEKKCGARCMSSTGPSCECSCGGRNHGSHHG